MAEPRDLLEDYVAAGRVMQLATLDRAGAPAVCNLWQASAFQPDRFYFISRPQREHCANIRADGRVSGAILSVAPTDYGDPVRGVSFTGRARELPTTGIDGHIQVYVGKWPKAARALDPRRLANGEAHHRVYLIEVAGWVLFDEVNFRGEPRQVIDAR